MPFLLLEPEIIHKSAVQYLIARTAVADYFLAHENRPEPSVYANATNRRACRARVIVTPTGCKLIGTPAAIPVLLRCQNWHISQRGLGRALRPLQPVMDKL